MNADKNQIMRTGAYGVLLHESKIWNTYIQQKLNFQSLKLESFDFNYP